MSHSPTFSPELDNEDNGSANSSESQPRAQGTYALPPPVHDPTGMYTRAYEERINQMPQRLPGQFAQRMDSPATSSYGSVDPSILEQPREYTMSSQNKKSSPKRKFDIEEHTQRPSSQGNRSFHESYSPDASNNFTVPARDTRSSYANQRQARARSQRPESSDFGGYEVVDDNGNVVDRSEYENSPFGHQSARKNRTQGIIGRDLSEEELFVDDESDSGEVRTQTRTSGRKNRFSSNDFQRSASTHRPLLSPSQAFNNIGENLAVSRYSGADMPWLLNQDPVMVPQNEVSDATLKKRRLSRGEGDMVCKRGYGANDPENIAIVNLYDIDGNSFPEIVKILNDERIARGHKPSLTVCGVTSRYSRNAPLLYQSNSMVFVPLSQRSKNPGQHGETTGKPAFDDNIDNILVEIVQKDEADKWERVAMELEVQTGMRMDIDAVAHRYALL